MRVFPDERQLGADAVGLFMQDWDHPIEPALQRKMEKAARAYAASYCSAPTGPSVQSCREAVEKVTIAGALLTRMKEDPRMTVRDAYAAELAYRDSDDYQGPWMPGEVSTTPFNKAVATKRECRFTLFFFFWGASSLFSRPLVFFFMVWFLLLIIIFFFFYFIFFHLWWLGKGASRTTQPSGSEKTASETTSETISVEKTGGNRKKKRMSSDVPDISGVLGADASGKQKPTPTESRGKKPRQSGTTPPPTRKGLCPDVSS